jgi:putative FmdB family regulatory protein
MPFYDFRCRHCENLFTIRATIKEKEDGLQPVCPVCQSDETRQMITAGILLGQAVTGNDRSLPSTCCGPGAGSGCCG